ncbi:MAG: hypothetical protein ACRET5_09265, partial [Steroidobacteraceae bacterium]
LSRRTVNQGCGRTSRQRQRDLQQVRDRLDPTLLTPLSLNDQQPENSKRVVPAALPPGGCPGDDMARRARGLPGLLSSFADALGGQSEAAAVDFVGHDALVKGLADRCIQPLQQLREALPVTAHETGDHGCLGNGDGGTCDRWHPSDPDVTACLIQ